MFVARNGSGEELEEMWGDVLRCCNVAVVRSYRLSRRWQ